MENSHKLILLADRLDFGGGVERMVALMAREFFHPLNREIALVSRRKLQHETACPVLSFGDIRHDSEGIIRTGFEFCATVVRFGIYRLSNRPNVVISFKEVPNFVNLLTLGKNSIISVRENKSHGIRFSGILRRLVFAIIRHVYNRARYIVVSSAGVKKDLVCHLGIDSNRVVIIPNPCDSAAISLQSREPLSEEWRFLERSRFIVSVSRLSIQKGFFNLIRVFRALVEHDPDVQLVIVGEGAEYAAIKRLINRYGIQSQVHLVGHQANPHKFMRRAVVTAITSYWEGFCNVIVESMACGTPVISTDCPDGPRSILDPSRGDSSPISARCFDGAYGVLAPQMQKVTDWDSALMSEEKIFLSGLIRFLEDPQLCSKYAKLGEMRVKDYSIESVSTLWWDLVEKLVRQHH